MFLTMFFKTQNIVQSMHLTMFIAHPYLELSDDVISLSDEELTMETSVVEKKRKRTSEKESKSSKSKKHRTDVKKSSREKKAEKNSAVFSSLDSNRPSKAQEEILLAAFR